MFCRSYIWKKQIKNIPTSAEIIYNLLIEMDITVDLEVDHTVWKSRYNSMDEATKGLMEFYKFKSNLEKKVKNFVENNSTYNGVKYVLS